MTDKEYLKRGVVLRLETKMQSPIWISLMSICNSKHHCKATHL